MIEKDVVETGIGTSNLRSLGRRAPLSRVVALLEAALHEGVRYIDTADTYGAGSAERALGTAFSRGELVSSRSHFRVITKGGYRFPDLPGPLRALNQPMKRAVRASGRDSSRFDDEYLSRAVLASRRRLATLPIHAYCLHNPPTEVLRDGAAVNALERLRDAGHFSVAGVSIDSFEDLPVVAGLDRVGLVEVPAAAWATASSEVQRRFADHGTEIVVNRITAIDPNPARALQRLAALAFPPDVAVVGTRDPDHLRSNAAAVGGSR